MTAFVLCIPCQYGRHDAHYDVVQPAPEGGVGGARCPCKGECVDERGFIGETETNLFDAIAKLRDADAR